MITDEYLLKHAGFLNYNDLEERVLQKQSQPENAERLMVLIDGDKGVLAKSSELVDDSGYELKEVSQSAKLVDILKVHDYRYVRDVIRKCK